MITKETFNCVRCADCCKHLTVKLSKKDIRPIKKAGYREEFFVEYDTHIRSPVLKLTDKGCIFLAKVKGMYSCLIYEIRPLVCKQYPFVNSDKVESCKPVLLKNKYCK